MKPFRCLVYAAAAVLAGSLCATAAVVSPTSVSLVQGSEYFPVVNLIDAGGTGGGSTWVTVDPNGLEDYYLATSPGPDPIIVFDLGADTTIDTLLTWPYGVSGNSARELTLRFATEADGDTGFGTSIPFSPTVIIPPSAPGNLPLNQEITTRYVEVTITDNYFDIAPPGGDRVGLAEVAFESAPDPAEAPTILTHPQTQTAFAGSTVTLSVSADGTQPWGYQWRKDGADLPGEVNDTLYFAAISGADVGTYDVVVTNSVGATTSDGALLLVKEVPLSPLSVTLLESSEFYPVANLNDGGGTAAGATWVTDNPNDTDDYFLFDSPGPEPVILFDLGSDVAIDSILVWPYSNTGNSARDFNLLFATEADGTNGFGTSIPFSPDLIAPDQPQTQPRTIGLGQTVTTRYVKMTITDNYFNISPPGGDRVGMSEVAFAPPLLGAAPVLIQDPQDQTTEFGSGVVIFDVDVFGSLPFTFQWRFEGVDVAGGTNQMLTLDNPGLGEQGNYDVVVANSEGAVTSQTASLTVTVAEVEPGTQGVVEGATAKFWVATEADTYQWSKDGAEITGATDRVLLLPEIAPGDAAAYTVAMSIGTSTAETAVAGTLNVLSAAGRSDYEMVVLSDTPRGYWRLGETSGTNAVDETGLHDGVYWNNPFLGQAGVIAGDPDTSVGFTQGAQTKVDIPFSADLNPGSFTMECWVQLTGGAGHRSPMTSRDDAPQEGYIFYVEPNGVIDFWTGPGWHQINGPTPAPLNEWVHLAGTYDAETQTKTLYINGQVDAVATGVTINPNDQRPLRIGAGATDVDPGDFFWEGGIDEVAVYGEALLLDRVRAHYLAGLYGGNSPPFIDGQPEDQYLVLGDTNAVITFSAVVSGSPPLSYQWSKGGAPIPGATAESYVITNAVPADVGIYALTVSNDLGVVTSDPAELLLTTAPVTPGAQTRLEGDTTTFSVTMPVDSTGYTYQWAAGGVDIAGAIEDTLELAGLTAGNSGNYTVTVTLGPDEATSEPASLAVVGLPTTSYASKVAGSIPVAWWRLGDPPGSFLALDEYQLNDADIIAGTDMGAAGALLGDSDTAAHFPGTADSKIELINTFDIATQEFTVEFWAVLEGGSGFRSPVTSRDIFEGEISGWTFYVTGDNTWQFRIGDGGPDWAGVIDGPPAVQGAWTHVVGSYDGYSMRFYIDGALVGEQDAVGYRPQDFVPLWIGAGFTEDVLLVGDFFWVGRVDEVAFYDRAISAGEVVDHWAGAFQPGTGPEITGDPQFAWTLPGGDASFSVAARGTPLVEYQWQKDGVDIPGATESTLALADVDLADAGFYSAVVSNSGGVVSSSDAELFVPGELEGPYRDLVLADSPVAYWPLDEAAGAVASDVIGTNDGAVVNGATMGASGAIPGDAGTAYGFTQASTQKVEVPYASELSPTNFSIEVWVAVTGGTSYRSPLTSRDDAPQRGFIFYADPDDNWQFWSGTGEDVGWSILDWGQGALTYGKWYHLVGTYDGTTKSLYVDGQLVGTQAVTIVPNEQQVLRIGAGSTEQDPGEWFFEGGVDEVAIYDQVLSLKQIASHYAAGVEVLPELVPMGIGLQGGMVTVTWDGDAVLQQSEDLPGDSWGDVSGDPDSPYTETTPAASRSFRLREP